MSHIEETLKRQFLQSLNIIHFDNIIDIILYAKDEDIYVGENKCNEFRNVIKFHRENNDYILKTYNSHDRKLTNEAYVSIVGTNNYNGFAKLYDVKFDNSFNNITYDYIIYEYIPGKKLNNYIRNLPIDYNPNKFKSILREIFNNLYEVHKDINFIHGDLNPNNIIISDNDSPVFIDLKVSRIEMDSTSNWKFDAVKLLDSLLEASNKENYFSDLGYALIDMGNQMIDGNIDDVERILNVNRHAINRIQNFELYDKLNSIVRNLLSYFKKSKESKELSLTDFEDFIKML